MRCDISGIIRFLFLIMSKLLLQALASGTQKYLVISSEINIDYELELLVSKENFLLIDLMDC